MKVLLLGSGTSVPGARAAPGLLVTADGEGAPPRTLLIDPGPGATHRLGHAGVPPTAVDDVLITHFHPDHVCDLVPFLFCLKNPRYGSPPYPRLIGPPGLAALYESLRAPFARWLPEPGSAIEIIETEETDLESGRFCLRGEKVHHLPSSLAWRITDIGGTTFAYSGDTEKCSGVVRAALGVDLLLCECSAPLGTDIRGHLDPATASEVIRDSGARRVILVHLNPECDEVDLVGQFDDEVRDRVELGRDGEWFTVGEASC